MDEAEALAWHEESVLTVLRREFQHRPFCRGFLSSRFGRRSLFYVQTMVTILVPVDCIASVAKVVGVIPHVVYCSRGYGLSP